MSSTSDYAEFRKSILEREMILRGSQTAVKKRNVPKKFTPLAPLDFNAIKREILEASSNELLPSVNYHKMEDNTSTQEFTSNNVSEKLECINEGVPVAVNKENPKQTKNKCLKPKENDSFDLDFSALSLHTPAKQNDFVSFKECTVNKPLFDSFVTPKVKNILPSKLHCSVPRTPVNVNNESVVLQPEKTPNNPKNIVCSIPRSIPDEKTFEKLQVNDVQYLILNLLGKGGSSFVYQCFCVEKRLLVAIKCVSLENAQSAQGYINEVKLLQRLQHCDRIIKLYDYQILEDEKKLFMVLEKGGEDFTTVLNNLTNQKTNIPIYMLLFYWMEMLQAVKQIHDHEIIHSDLKPSNFLWGEKGLKLIDFGIASSVQTDMTSVIKTIPEGSCNYMSPEALRNDTSSPGKNKYQLHYKSDVWSLGCILYQMVYKRTPFHHLKKLWTKLAFIMDPNHRIEYPDVTWVPVKIVNTIKKCLEYNVRLRPSVDELLREYDSNLCNI
ncbi:dual specificity protein kinase Ttk [Diorhabda sublineata]|uniref:dual specificity protein kinase Ttk n=1 Tax=Diorhabda sublineata TaxID=1163346 RepID=UPI0024E12B63|nr:dual specificity protein kinase Ttk [Diorhabda sublineata]